MIKNIFQFQEGLNLKIFRQRFGTEKQCRETLFKWYWPKGYCCPECGYGKYHAVDEGLTYKCQRCEYEIVLFKNTIFIFFKLPLHVAFKVKYTRSRIKKGLSNLITKKRYTRLRVQLSILVKILKKARRDLYGAMIVDEYSGIYINWNLPPHRWNNITKIHWCYTRSMWRNKKFYALLSFAAWPLKSIIFAYKNTRQFGPKVRQKAGVSKMRQYFDQIYLAFRYFVPPSAYYFHSLYEPHKYNNASLYIHHHEVIPILMSLTMHENTVLSVLNEKRRFHWECTKFGLPTIQTIAEFEKGGISRWVDSSDDKVPAVDLFVKPANGICGQGVKLFTYEGNHQYRGKNHLITKDQLVNLIVEQSKSQPYLLQPRISNHPDISSLYTESLCTIRVVTYRSPMGTFEYLTAFFKMATGDRVNDNFATGGLAAPIDEKTGILGWAISKNLDDVRVEFHPDTGSRIAGVQLPFWKEVVRLCKKAHNAFSEFCFVGWDLAITEHGPILVEANVEWGMDALQKAHDQPIGLTIFPEVFLEHFQRQGDFNTLFKQDFWKPDDLAEYSPSVQ